MEKKIIVTIRIPLTPNFIEAGDKMLPVADFTEEELRQIGQEWIEQLVKKAKLKSLK